MYLILSGKAFGWSCTAPFDAFGLVRFKEGRVVLTESEIGFRRSLISIRPALVGIMRIFNFVRH